MRRQDSSRVAAPAPKERTTRYYQLMWEEWRAERVAKGMWLNERRESESRRRLLKHPVAFQALQRELTVLARWLGDDLPLVVLSKIDEHGLVGSDGRWNPAPAGDPKIKKVLGRVAAEIIASGWRQEPAFAYIVWDCGVEASNFAAAVKQVRDAHEAHLEACCQKLTSERPPEVK